MRVCVVIPTYNEEKEIAGVLEGIKEQGLQAVVVDDGSTDKTAGIAEEKGAVVLRNKANLGKGASLVRGFEYALKDGFEAVITMDGDGQHDPVDIPEFMRGAQGSPYGVFIGNRMAKPHSMPWLRIATNKFMSWFISCLAGQAIPDTQCGFRLIKKEALQKLELKTRNYEIESEMIIKAARQGFKVESINITTVYRNEKSRINPFVDTLRFISYISRELWTWR